MSALFSFHTPMGHPDITLNDEPDDFLSEYREYRT